MGTYISHFRIAESLLIALENLEDQAFLFGNLAPDSGTPNEDWSHFNPPRTITHFLGPGEGEGEGEGEGKIKDMEFRRQYMLGTDAGKEDCCYSFFLGYFFHLVCDTLWSSWIVKASILQYESIIREKEANAWSEIRQDWHDLDRKYFRDHSQLEIWRLMKSLHNPPECLEYLPQEVMRQQMDYIEHVYLKPKEGKRLDRGYPYLAEATMDRFVKESTQIIIEIMQRRDELMRSDSNTALSIFESERMLPYEYPLGDMSKPV